MDQTTLTTGEEKEEEARAKQLTFLVPFSQAARHAMLASIIIIIVRPSSPPTTILYLTKEDDAEHKLAIQLPWGGYNK